MTVQNLTIAEIVTDPDTQPRVKMSVAAAIEYGDELHGGAEFPPVVVFFDSNKYWLADGNHRLTAHETEGRTTIQAEVHEGSKRDAILYACGANATNGIRRTNADKRQAVGRLLADAEWSKWSNVRIADQCAVSEHLVRLIAVELSSTKSKTDNPIRLVTRNGTTYQQNTRNIGKAESPLLRGDLEFTNGKPLPPDTFYCDCGEAFDREVWHCPGCAHHWDLRTAECKNCHEFERPEELTDGEIARFQETSRKQGVTTERTSIVYGVISSIEDLAALDVTPEDFWTSLCYEYSKPSVLKALPAANKWLHRLSILAKEIRNDESAKNIT